MDGGTDVLGGSVPAGPQGSDGGGDEHQGGLPGARPAPGHSAQEYRYQHGVLTVRAMAHLPCLTECLEVKR